MRTNRIYEDQEVRLSSVRLRQSSICVRMTRRSARLYRHSRCEDEPKELVPLFYHSKNKNLFPNT